MSAAEPAPGLPIRARAEVLANVAEGPGQHRLTVSVDAWPGAAPGQFVMVSAGALASVPRTDPLLPRPMAIYRGHAPAESGPTRIEILYKATGRGTRLLAEALPGQRVGVVGPLGTPFPEIPAAVRAILVGGGTGIASLYEVAARARGARPPVVVLGARSARDLMGVADFEALGVELLLTTEDGSAGLTGRVTDRLAPLLASAGAADTVVYACGPTPMMRACHGLARARGVRCIVSLENNMACGFGVCLGCAVPVVAGGYSLVCRAGPVYDAAAVAWDGLP